MDLLNIPMQYVYLLKCSDNSTYTGCTQNIQERLKRHANKEVKYTSTRLPVSLITYIAFSDKYKAFNFEKYLKSGSGKAFSNKRFIWSANQTQKTQIFITFIHCTLVHGFSAANPPLLVLITMKPFHLPIILRQLGSFGCRIQWFCGYLCNNTIQPWANS